MAASTSKRVFLYRFDRQPLEGIVNPATFLQDGQAEIITALGNLIGVAYRDMKAVCFVADAGHADLFEVHPFFERRPKSPGLWTRFTFRDGARLDGLLSHDLLEWPEHGYFVTPPHASANRQRVFIPRLALTHTELRGVVGVSSIAGGKRGSEKAETERQLPMFE